MPGQVTQDKSRVLGGVGRQTAARLVGTGATQARTLLFQNQFLGLLLLLLLLDGTVANQRVA